MPHSSAVKKRPADGAESSEDGPELTLKKRRSTKCRLGVVRTSVDVGSEASSGN